MISLTRPQLYDRIWTNPVSRVATELGLSDVGLRKICQRFEIPLPPLGYWAKKQYGKRVNQKALRPIEGLDSEAFEFRRDSSEADQRLPDPDVTTLLEREQLDVFRILVQDSLSDPHELVERTRKSMAGTEPDDCGLVRPKAKRCLNVAVSPALLDRAMLILDAVTKALDKRGIRISCNEVSEGAERVTVLGESLVFALEELTERRERKLTKEGREDVRLWGYGRDCPRYEYVPAGRLSIHIACGPVGVRHRWSDSGRQKLETLLNAFSRGLIHNAEGLKLARVEAEKRRREFEKLQQARWEEAERQRIAEQRRREEQARLEELERLATNWRRSDQIRLFANAVERAAGDRGEDCAPGSNLASWLSWARSKADELDPIAKLLKAAAMERG